MLIAESGVFCKTEKAGDAHGTIRTSGGSDGILDEGLLDAAVHAPFQTFGQTDAYPSVQQKAARLGYGLVKNHAFVDGNKRIGA